MSILVEYKYANILSSRLSGYTQKSSSPFLANCRCPVCGDSKTNKAKKRGYLYEKKGVVRFTCHNCGYNSKLGFFLKEYYPDIFKEYLLDVFEDSRKVREADPILTPKKPAHELAGGQLNGLKRVSQLSHNHPAKKYIDSRQLPPATHSRLYFTPNFMKWINGLIPEKFAKYPKYDPRIIIPFFDKKGDLFAVQGRALTDKQERYITIKFDEDHPKVFGLDKIDPNYRIWVLEGPFDSLFIPNSLAMAGADISIDALQQLVQADKSRFVKVYDNEPRNEQIVQRMQKDIEDGLSVVIWPRSIKEKDINNMIVKQKLSAENILMFMNRNTYKGLEAKLKLAEWSKI